MKDGETRVELGGLLKVRIMPAKDQPEISTLMIRVSPKDKALPSFAKKGVNDEATAADHILTLVSKALKESGMEEMPNEQPYSERVAATRARAADHGRTLGEEGHATIDAGVGSFPERNPKNEFNGEAMVLRAEIALRKIDRYLTDALDMQDATEKLAAAAKQMAKFGKTLEQALDPSQHEESIPDDKPEFIPSRFTPRQNKMIDAIHAVLPETVGRGDKEKPFIVGVDRIEVAEAIVAGVIGLNDDPPQWKLKPDEQATEDAAIEARKLGRRGKSPAGEPRPQAPIPPDKDALTEEVKKVLVVHKQPEIHEMQCDPPAQAISEVILKQLENNHGIEPSGP